MNSSAHPSSRVVEGSYLADLLAQPKALRDAAASMLARLSSLAPAAERLRRGEFRRIVLTGMGSSLHALYPLYLRLTAAGHACTWIETAELLHSMPSLRGQDMLGVVVSQSGESAETVQLLERSGGWGYTIGVTNQPDSTLGRRADVVLPLAVGPEATVSCKTYVATLLALDYLGDALVSPRSTPHDPATLASSIAEVERYLGRWRDHVAAWSHALDGIEALYVTGRGTSLATAGTGGLILKEATGMPAEGMSCAAFRHGPLELADARRLVLVFAGDPATAPLNQRLYEDIVRGGGRAVWLGPANDSPPPATFAIPTSPPAWRPVLEILPVQMLSLAVAARDGREAGRFTRATKITATA